MRLPFQKARPRWVDSPDLAWTPEQPLRPEPSARAPKPAPRPAAKPAPSKPERLTAAQRRAARAPRPARAEPVIMAPIAKPRREPPKAPPSQPVNRPALPPQAPPLVVLQSEIPPSPANTNQPQRRNVPSLPLYLGIGLGQGLGLYLLFQTRDANLLPGNNPDIFAALSLPGLFAPLLLLEGLGDVALYLLVPWTALLAAGLGALGWYHHWRIQAPEQAHAGFSLVILTALALFILQALLRTLLSPERPREYRQAFHTGWTLAARLLVWALLTGTAWALIGSGNSLINWLRPHYPGLRPGIDLTLVTMPLVAVASAFAMHLTSGPVLSRLTRNAMLACCTLALPPLVAVCAAGLVANFAYQRLSMALCLTGALLLVICLNASYRADPSRRRWRRWSEFAASFAIIGLTALATVALDARVAAFGWTGPRVYACAVLVILTCYGITYGGAALISIGGGRWMQRIEIANIAMAVAVAAAAVALMTPVADPLRLAVESQSRRVESGAVDPAAFDYDWMRLSGLRFGHDALLAMTSGPSREAARNAAITLSVAPGTGGVPTPTEIGANITVRTPGARLPGKLLAHDWSSLGKSVPPCLTVAALACDAWFMDLDGDGRDEILLVYGNDAHWWASVMKKDALGAWNPAAGLTSPPCRGSLTALRLGAFTPADPLSGWRDLLVAGERLRLTPTQEPPSHCPL